MAVASAHVVVGFITVDISDDMPGAVRRMLKLHGALPALVRGLTM